MSAPAPGTSSGTAQRSEEALMAGDNAGDGRGLGRRVPLVDFESATEDDAVGPREHVAGTAGEGILHLRLRLEDRELAAGRMKVLIVEQVAAAEPGAVEDEALRQRSNIRGRRELADLEFRAGDLHVPD